jgi:WD40-like Beta Propeller Repeat
VPTSLPGNLAAYLPKLEGHVLKIDYAGKVLVINGPIGCCLDADPRKSGDSVALPNRISAHFLQVEPHYGGPILWWRQEGTYIAISGPRLTKDVLIAIAASMSKTAGFSDAVALPPPGPEGALPAGPIVFALNDPGPQSCDWVRIQIMYAGDTRPTYLADGCLPILSPDQKQIVYVKDTAVFVMNADGRHQQQITGTGITDHRSTPAWSPDSRQIAFVGSQNDETAIYIVEADGKGLRRLTKQSSEFPIGTSFSGPIWSPDGQQIAFGIAINLAAPNDKANGIFTVKIDGTEIKRLTKAHEFQVPSGWSPDGKAILYEWNANGSNSFALVSAGGRLPALLGDNRLDASEAAWSPDGQRIAFVSNRDGNGEIYTLDIASGRQTRLTNMPTQEFNPSWSSDGQFILFGSFALDSAGASIYVMRADGSQLVRVVTSESGLMWYPKKADRGYVQL